jgi:hypothetical protein
MAAAAITAVASIAGGYLQYKGQQQQTAALQKAERLRERQMNLQAQRERRDAIRQAMAARATALATATSQGASAAGSSALGGAYGQITGEANRQILAINQNQEIGAGIFKANRQYSQASLTTGFGSMVAGVGGAVGGFMESAVKSGAIPSKVGGVKIA